MYYESIELINYGGLYNGIGLQQLKLDFTKCTHNKILISGPNGSGKSTIISAINPFPDGNERFVPNEEARKTLVLVDNTDGTKYIIRYIHPVDGNGNRITTRGYISKVLPNSEPLELNPNGNVTSCKDLISSILEFDPGFAILSQISSEDRGLVERKPTERKRIISYIVNSLDTYNSIYKTISKKHVTIKNLINNLSNKISMIGDETKLNVSLNSILQQIAETEERKKNLIETSATMKVRKNELLALLEENKYDDIIKELKNIEIIINNHNKSINNILTLYKIQDVTKLKPFLESITKESTILETEMLHLKSELEQNIKDRSREVESLKDKKEQLNSIQSDINEINIKSTLDNLYIKSNGYKSTFDKMGLLDINIITKDEFDSAMESLNNLKLMSDAIRVNHDLDALHEYINNRQHAITLLNEEASIKNEIELLEQNLTELNKEYVMASAKREIASELINRPKECKIDTCIYIAAALQADREYPEEKFISIENIINDTNNRLVNYKNTLNYIYELKSVAHDIDIIEKELSSSWKFLKKFPIRVDFKETFLSRVLNHDPFKDIDELYKFVDCGNMLEEYKITLENIKIYENEYKLYKSKEDIINSIINDIDNLNKKISEIDISMSTVNGTIISHKSRLKELSEASITIRSLIDKYELEFKPMIDKRNELLETKSKLDSSVEVLNELEIDFNKINELINSVNAEIKNLSDQKEVITHSLLMLAEYKKEYAEYKREAEIVEKIRYYSSPITGIQNVFLNVFMSKILQTANKLLGYLFNGRFMLGNFVINETEFKIPCIGTEGIMHDDISNMSTAEKSMLSMIISFALLNQSSTKYNVISLDEIDGALDSSNRSNFIIVLDQIMQLLQVQQVFIISHNSELDYSFCDVINLSRDPIPNAHVIWHI